MYIHSLFAFAKLFNKLEVDCWALGEELYKENGAKLLNFSFNFRV